MLVAFADRAQRRSLLQYQPISVIVSGATAWFTRAGAMSEFIPVTNEMLERARNDCGFRHRLILDHLKELMVAMSTARDRTQTEASPDPAAISLLNDGAQLAVKLTEMLRNLKPGSL
jgi:hypothetical protein